MDWSADDDANLREWRRDGFSFGLIERKFKDLGQKRSKGAIIGRAFRLSILGPSKPVHALERHNAAHYGAQRNKSTIAPRNAINALLALRSKPGTARLANADVVPGPGAFLGIALVDLCQDHCRFPQGELPILFCGQPQVEGSPYCEKHTNLCFVRR